MAVKRYDGSAWQTVAGLGAQGPAATSSSIATWVKTASGGETSVSGNDDNSQPLSYTVGQELVFINGVLQKRGDDYTATTGNSITGLTALTAGDIVSVWTVNAFSVTNAISNTIMDAKGDLLTASSADVPARLAVGANDTVLTADSTTATGLKWAAPAATGDNWTLLNSGGTALTGATTVTVSGISGKNKILVILAGASASAFSNFPVISVRLNTDTGNNYYNYGWFLKQPSTFQNNSLSILDGQGFTNQIPIGRMSNNGSGNSVVEGAVTISGCNSNGVKTYIANGVGSLAGWYDNEAYSLQGYYNSSSTISSISIFSNNGNLDAGTVYVYATA